MLLIVQRSQLTTANAFLQSTTNIGVCSVRPSAGGIALIGAQRTLRGCRDVSGVGHLPHADSRERQPTVKGLEALSTPVVHMMVGFRFVFLQHRVVFALMTAAVPITAISAFVFLLPVVYKDLPQVGTMELGWLWSALGIGMLAALPGWYGCPKGNFRVIEVGKIVPFAASVVIMVCTLGLVQTPVLFSTFPLIVIIGEAHRCSIRSSGRCSRKSRPSISSGECLRRSAPECGWPRP
ncbi:MAG: hypothetical protein U0361_20800 [Nitrospiraceae bacterium]